VDLILITADPVRAQLAAEAGVDRVMVDLEMVGKRERQGHLDTLISGHTAADISIVRRSVPDATLVVRTDPWPYAQPQVAAAIEAGADVLMLPMFTGPDEVNPFVAAVDGRARVLLLLETAEGVRNLQQVLAVPGVDEVHVGLNDLHLQVGSRFMFEPLADGTVERIAQAVHEAGIRFGFGGVGRVGGSGILSPELVLSEHVRLGSTQVILSRDFLGAFDNPTRPDALAHEVSVLRRAYDALSEASPATLTQNARELRRVVAAISASRDVPPSRNRSTG
jgi:2-keto-3-deoxy-L-rhamnonate aldolase RhmA